MNSIQKKQQEILRWYKKNKRDLPWRQTHDPYAILVSEVMLQQTQVTRVLPKYHEWLKKFPTVAALAQASVSEILSVWVGLGYNRRALFLQKAAQTIVKEYAGQFPRTISELEKLPGVGPYTARAVACFAFNAQVAVVDTNVKKVLLTQFADLLPDTKEKTVQRLAERLVPENKSYVWNQALMDYASNVLKNERIFIPKQSPFIGSKRFYRGKMLRLLTRKSHMDVLKLENEVVDAVFVQKKYNFSEILTSLAREGFITLEKRKVSLK